MIAPRRQTLFESATARARVRRHFDIACLTFDGNGSMVVSMQEFARAQRWANSRMASGNLITDRGRFVETFQAVVSRPGSLTPTRGNPRLLEMLVRSMRAAGYDVGEWSLPPELKHPVRPTSALDARKPPGATQPPEPQGMLSAHGSMTFNT